jgi:hypothetical protein
MLAASIEMSQFRCDAAGMSEVVFIPPVIAAFVLLLVALRGLGSLD